MTHADHAAARALAEEIIDRFDRSRNATWPANAEQWAMAERLASIRAEFIARALLSALDREARVRALVADLQWSGGRSWGYEDWTRCCPYCDGLPPDGPLDHPQFEGEAGHRDSCALAAFLSCPPPASAEGGA